MSWSLKLFGWLAPCQWGIIQELFLTPVPPLQPAPPLESLVPMCPKTAEQIGNKQTYRHFSNCVKIVTSNHQSVHMLTLGQALWVMNTSFVNVALSVRACFLGVLTSSEKNNNKEIEVFVLNFKHLPFLDLCRVEWNTLSPPPPPWEIRTYPVVWLKWPS